MQKYIISFFLILAGCTACQKPSQTVSPVYHLLDGARPAQSLFQDDESCFVLKFAVDTPSEIDRLFFGDYQKGALWCRPAIIFEKDGRKKIKIFDRINAD